MSLLLWVTLIAVLLVVGWVVIQLLSPSGRRRQAAEREALEDLLKQLLDWQAAGESAERSRLSSVVRLSPRRLDALVEKMVGRGLVEEEAGSLHLTSDGEQWATQVARAHRLWELYLADEARLPMRFVHQTAHHLEHRVSPEELDALDAHLGHPLYDPHGDPIPSASGSLPAKQGTNLAEWPVGEEGRITHLEDEPVESFTELMRAGIRVGSRVRLRGLDEQEIRIEQEDISITLPRRLAANITVGPSAGVQSRPIEAMRLADLPDGAEGRILEIDPDCRGFTRRRLLDFGLTPGARIKAELRNALGDPRAFRVRGTVVALRREQAAQVWIEKVAERRAS